jgi:phenylacetate-CoA ligase
MIYPSNLAAMLDLLERDGRHLPSVQRVRTIGETLSPAIRERAEHDLGATVRDCYSSEEVGYIAIECPTGGLYHVMAETLIVEVVDADGRACREGEVGRVLVTDLHNRATPLIRYAIGDMAEVGPACPCGRGLPTLRRIVGRERNMLLTPDGRRAWPLTGFRDFATIAPVIQYQLIQHRIDAVEVRLVVGAPIDAGQERALAALITRSLGYPFTLTFKYFPDRIPRQPNGKFEEFVNLVG